MSTCEWPQTTSFASQIRWSVFHQTLTQDAWLLCAVLSSALTGCGPSTFGAAEAGAAPDEVSATAATAAARNAPVRRALCIMVLQTASRVIADPGGRAAGA